jgi:hypothetical protein
MATEEIKATRENVVPKATKDIKVIQEARVIKVKKVSPERKE